MQEAFDQAANFLDTVFTKTGLEMQVKVKETVNGPVLDIAGADAELLQMEGAELLEALQYLLNQAFGRTLTDRQRLVCDVNGFRATREAELFAMANHAASQVRSSGLPFTFGPMNAGERRIIHLTLADQEDLFTESIGEGNERKLKVALRDRSQ